MKCDQCVHQLFCSASPEYPYPVVFCSKEHWTDSPEHLDDALESQDPWGDCEDFEQVHSII